MKTANYQDMKTTDGRSNTHPTSLGWKCRWQTAVIAAMVTMLLTAFVPTGQASNQSSKSKVGVATARFLYSASLSEATADYNVALANANNEPTPEARTEARMQAKEDYNEARDFAREQFDARRELVIALDEDRYNPVIAPSNFLSVSEITAAPNPLFPLVPGTIYNFRSAVPEGTETVEFTVTRGTRTILGVTCIVVRDIVRLNGSVTEDTVDWFAQDRSGNVWYFGENTAEYEGELITTTAGSWEAGVSGAKPGIIMFAQPVVGKVYRQELFLGEAEDAARVMALNETVTVAAGSYSNCLKTEDFTPIEPGQGEIKYYAPGIGNVLTISPDTGKRVELISVTRD